MIEGITNGEIRSAGDYNLKDITIRGISVRQIFQEFNLYEDLFSPTLTGELLLSDSLNLSLNFPIIGGEEVLIEFGTPSLDNIKIKFIVSAMPQRILQKERAQVIQLSLVSSEVFTDIKTRVSRSWKETKASEVVRTLLAKYLETDKEIEIEETLFPKSFVVPGWSPFETIFWLAKRNRPVTEYKDPSLVFFETTKGYQFVSLASLFSKPVSKTFHYSNKNIRSLERFASRTIDNDMRNILSYKIKSFDIPRAMRSGYLGNRMLSVNPFDRTFKSVEALPSDFETMNSSLPIPSSFEDPTNLFQMICKPTNVYEGMANSFLDEIIPFRQTRMNSLFQYGLEFTIPGDSSLRVGNMINVQIPSPEPQEEKITKMDSNISGNHLITALRHQVTLEKYTCHLETALDSF